MPSPKIAIWFRIASAIGPTLVGIMLGKGGVDAVFL